MLGLRTKEGIDEKVCFFTKMKVAGKKPRQQNLAGSLISNCKVRHIKIGCLCRPSLADYLLLPGLSIKRPPWSFLLWITFHDKHVDSGIELLRFAKISPRWPKMAQIAHLYAVFSYRLIHCFTLHVIPTCSAIFNPDWGFYCKIWLNCNPMCVRCDLIHIPHTAFQCPLLCFQGAQGQSGHTPFKWMLCTLA